MSTGTTNLVANRFHKVTFERAQGMAKTILDSNPAPELKSQVDEALASHPGNPANGGNPSAKPSANGSTTREARSEGSVESNGEARAKVGRVWEVTLGGISEEEIEAKVAAGEITFKQALAMSQAAEKLTVFCSEKSGWISLSGRGRFPANMHPQLLRRILTTDRDTLLAILDEHAEETEAALAKAKASK